jgi:hypothetical protein
LAFLRLPLSQSHTGTPAVLLDELDAGRFQGAANDVKRRTTWLAYCRLQLMDGNNADTCLPRELLLVPSKESACCSGLRRSDHEGEDCQK